jgi:hypothetical protein
MQSLAWVALLRHIPIEQQSRFMLVTSHGAEIAIQSLVIIESECVVIKGRLSGTQDTGRIFFVPYANIDYFGFQQAVKDTEFTDLFGGLSMPPPPAHATPAAAQPTSNGESPEPPPERPSKPDSGPRPSIRSVVLERFRARPNTASRSASD